MADEDVLDDGAELVRRDRFLQKIDGAEFHRVDGVWHIGVSGDEDDRGRDARVVHLLEQLEAGHLRHAEVEDADVVTAGEEHLEGLGSGVGFVHFEHGVEGGAVHQADVALVIDDEYGGVHGL